MNSANVRQKATAQDYIAFRNKIGTGNCMRASGKNEIRLLQLHSFVKEGEEFMACSLKNALKDGGVSSFFRLKKEIAGAIEAEQNPNVREIGNFMLAHAEAAVLSGPEFGRDTLIHAARLRDARAWQE